MRGHWAIDPRNGPRFDGSGPLGAGTWIVASIPRSGSTLLCRGLWDTGAVGAPKEYLNPMQVRDWEVRYPTRWGSRLVHFGLRGPALALAGRGPWTDARLRTYLAQVRARRAGAAGLGLKLHYHHLERWFLAPGRDPDVFLGPIRWIRIRRRDRVAQAVSWARARQTGRWVFGQAGWLPPVYSARRIAHHEREIARGEAGWDRFLAGRRVVAELDYEDLAEDFHGSLRWVLGALGASTSVLPDPPLQRQADATSRAWCGRYRASMGRSAVPFGGLGACP